MIQPGRRGGLVGVDEKEDQDKVRPQRGAPGRQTLRESPVRHRLVRRGPGLRYRAGNLLERRRAPVAEVIGRDVRVGDVRGDEGATAASLDARGDGGVDALAGVIRPVARCFRPPLASNSNTETTAGPAAIRLQSLGAPGTESTNPDPHPAAAHTRITANIRTCAPGTRG